MEVFKDVCPACGIGKIKKVVVPDAAPRSYTVYGQCGFIPCGYTMVGTLEFPKKLIAKRKAVAAEDLSPA